MNRIPYILIAGRAKESLPGGSLKYLFVYLKIRIFKCSYRICNSICLLTMNCQAVLLELLCQVFFFCILLLSFLLLVSSLSLKIGFTFASLGPGSSLRGSQGISGDLRGCPCWACHRGRQAFCMWVCLKIGYIPNYSHLIGIYRDNDH